MHFGIKIVGIDYGFQGQMRNDEVTGGALYGATTITDGDSSGQPSETELDGARYLGKKVASIATKTLA
jgi:NAD(P)H dehydrogenase (quinone)